MIDLLTEGFHLMINTLKIPLVVFIIGFVTLKITHLIVEIEILGEKVGIFYLGSMMILYLYGMFVLLAYTL